MYSLTRRLPALEHGRLERLWPFAVVAAAGQLSAGWSPGPSNTRDFTVSCALLTASGLLALFVPRGLAGVHLVVATTYVASVTFLMLATGGEQSGFGPLLLIPVVALALYGRRWESVAVVAPIMAALLSVSLASPHVPAATARRALLFAAVAAMLSIAVHSLRRRLSEANDQTTRLLQQAEAINMAARELASLNGPGAIRDLGVELASRIATQPGSRSRRSVYFHVEDDWFRIDAQFDAAGSLVGRTYPLIEHPVLTQVVESREPIVTEIDLEQLGPTVRPALESAGVTHVAFVPVCPDGRLDGVLAIAGRGTPIGPESLDLCVALGHLLELGLSNWNAHQRLEEQATAEERRRIARDLHDGLAHELAFIASRARRSARVGPRSSDMRELANAADRALDEARRAITVLSAKEPQSLAAGLAQAAEDLGDRLGLPVRVDISEDVTLPGRVTENLLRIVREAITNAANHGHPQNITVRLKREDGLHLVIEDDGCGFEPQPEPGGQGFGLLSMEERAASVGANLHVASSPAHGTRVEVALP